MLHYKILNIPGGVSIRRNVSKNLKWFYRKPKLKNIIGGQYAPEYPLTPHYSSPDLRFEVDGANAARDFLKNHGFPKESLQLVWDTIALHTTIGIAEHKEAEVALMYSGVGLDVMGEDYEYLSEAHRAEIIHAFPRTDFKKKIIPAFFEGFKHKTDTTFGNIKADVCAFMIPNFERKNFCDCILHSPWSE